MIVIFIKMILKVLFILLAQNHRYKLHKAFKKDINKDLMPAA